VEVGAALLRAYLRKLAADGVPGVHAVTTERNEAAVRLYRGFGFTVLAEATTHAWKRYVGGPLRLIAFGLRLSPDDFAEASARGRSEFGNE
jgi:ribosomal protein S18 acetylase RimI-like enzyme